MKLRSTLNLFVKTLVEPVGHLKQLSVADETYHVSSPVQHCFAVLAFFEVSFHALAHFARNLVIKEIGDFPPYFEAADFNCRHCILLVLSPWPNLLIRLSSNTASIDSGRERVPHL